MANLLALQAELLNDPLGRGYSAMTDQQAADSLNTADRSRTVPSVSPTDVFQAVVPGEYNATTPDQKQVLGFIFSLPTVPTSGNAATALMAIFGAGTTTRQNLIDLATETVSRAVELLIGEVHAGDVAEARA